MYGFLSVWSVDDQPAASPNCGFLVQFFSLRPSLKLKWPARARHELGSRNDLLLFFHLHPVSLKNSLTCSLQKIITFLKKKKEKHA